MRSILVLSTGLLFGVACSHAQPAPAPRDERGTREYNLALGQRRADGARKYLENLGMESARISTVSYGNERPRATGHNEAAWKQNRRDDLIPSPGKVAVSSSADQTTR